MATLKEIRISREWGTRPTDNSTYVGDAWYVEKGEKYDLVSFMIGEVDNYYWHTSLCLPCGTSEEEARKKAEEYAQNEITQEEIDSYKRFLSYGEKYGWD